MNINPQTKLNFVSLSRKLLLKRNEISQIKILFPLHSSPVQLSFLRGYVDHEFGVIFPIHVFTS
jgi:hypothetical protein